VKASSSTKQQLDAVSPISYRVARYTEKSTGAKGHGKSRPQLKEASGSAVVVTEIPIVEIITESHAFGTT
jgi:hypothetical protein